MGRQLVEQAVAGDHEAFVSLAAAAYDRLHGIARLILRDGDAASDAVQEALTSAWLHIRAVRDPDRLDAWLNRLAVHASYREARRRRGRVVEIRVTPVEVPDGWDAVGAVDARDQLDHAFRRLNPQQRAVLVVHHYLGLSDAEAAAVLRIPVGTVKSRLNRATIALRAGSRRPSSRRHQGGSGMNARDELDRRLAAWMTETASAPPRAGRFEQAIEATARRQPRPRWLAALGSDWVGAAAHPPVVWVWTGRRAGLALVTVILTAVAVVGVGIFGHSSVTGPSVGAPSATPTHGPSGGPIPLPSAGSLAPGTYSLANPYAVGNPVRNCDRGCADYRQIIFTLPAGWATSDGLVYKHLGEPGEVAFSAWTVDQVYADPCHWQGSTLSPLDLVDHSHDQTGAIVLAPGAGGLANQALRGPSPRALTPATLGGQSALRIDLSVPAGLDISTCDNGQFRSWTEWKVVDGADSHYATGQLDTVYEIDVDRRPLVIDASHMPATSREDRAELDAVLTSMVIDRGGGVGAQTADSTAGLSGPQGIAVPGAVLTPGAYELLDIDHQGFNVRFTVPAGWTWTGRSLSKVGAQPTEGDGAIYLFGGPVQVYANPCHWAGPQSTLPPISTAVDLMTALTAQPRRTLTAPVDRAAASEGLSGRWPGKSVVLSVPGDVDFTACDDGQFRSWGPDNKARSHQGPGQRDLVWAVDINGGLIVDAASFSNTPSGVITEMDAILASVITGHWG